MMTTKFRKRIPLDGTYDAVYTYVTLEGDPTYYFGIEWENNVWLYAGPVTLAGGHDAIVKSFLDSTNNTDTCIRLIREGLLGASGGRSPVSDMEGDGVIAASLSMGSDLKTDAKPIMRYNFFLGGNYVVEGESIYVSVQHNEIDFPVVQALLAEWMPRLDYVSNLEVSSYGS